MSFLAKRSLNFQSYFCMRRRRQESSDEFDPDDVPVKRKAREVKIVEENEEEDEESDDGIKEGINDLMNLPIELIRKELIHRKFQKTVVNHLPQKILVSMLRDSSKGKSYAGQSSFRSFYGNNGFLGSSYCERTSKPIFSEDAETLLNQESQHDLDTQESQTDNQADQPHPIGLGYGGFGNHILGGALFNNGPMMPRHVIQNPIFTTPAYIPHLYAPQQPAPPVKTEKEAVMPNGLPVKYNTQLLNNSVVQSTIDKLSQSQINVITDDFNRGLSASLIISKYHIETMKPRHDSDAETQETDTETQTETEKSASSSSSSSSSSDKEDDEEDPADARW